MPFNAPHGASTFDRKAPQAPEKYRRLYGSSPDWKAEYPALITQMDGAIGALLEQVRKLGLDDNTLVLFTSDNGATGPGTNGPLRGLKGDLFEGGIRMPLIARWPGRFPKGVVCREFASTLEFFPTFVAAARGAPPPGVKLDGFNLLPVLEGRAGSPRKEFFWQYRSDRAARVGQWKWVQSRRAGGLFDLASDLGEKRDLSAEKPDVLAMMKARWTAWRKEMDESEPRGPFRDY